jgi:hypothetical protein
VSWETLTPADHKALAARYDALAAEAEKEAARHEAMGRMYQASKFPKGGASQSLIQHCENLTKDLKAEAAEYRAMAEAHRQMVK